MCGLVRAPSAVVNLRGKARLAAVIPSGWPAACGRGGMGLVRARAAGSIKRTAAPLGAGARQFGDHALPAAGPAHAACFAAALAARHRACPSRIA